MITFDSYTGFITVNHSSLCSYYKDAKMQSSEHSAETGECFKAGKSSVKYDARLCRSKAFISKANISVGKAVVAQDALL